MSRELTIIEDFSKKPMIKPKNIVLRITSETLLDKHNCNTLGGDKHNCDTLLDKQTAPNNIGLNNCVSNYPGAAGCYPGARFNITGRLSIKLIF